MSKIRTGSRVSMHFSITLEDGTVAESSFDNDPLRLVVGDGVLNDGLEQVLLGLKTGDESEVELKPEQAFGYHDPDNVHTMPLSDFDVLLQPEVGQIIGFTTPTGDEVPGMVIAVDDDQARIDFNHPLAGHDLLYKVKILSVE